MGHMQDRTIDYDRLGYGYSEQRRADPRIARRINDALGDARTVVNVGAGAGSYEPSDRFVLAIEPSATMRAQRPGHLPPAIDASAESLPLDDDSVDAALAVLTLHHWPDQIRGLREMRRVARAAVVVVTFDVERLGRFWLIDEYLPEVLEDDRGRFPAIDEIAAVIGPDAGVETVPIPGDCVDGFFEAFYNRPDQYLEPHVRAAQSAWPRLPPGAEQRALAALADDLRSGVWERRHGHLRSETEYDGGLRLIRGS
jgi:SAM-dependent methyltransferase